MDIYDTRRERLQHLIKQLEMSHAAFGRLVGYNGQYIGQLVNRTKRSSGGKATVSDKVVGKILAKVKNLAPELSREWFDQPVGEPVIPRAVTAMADGDEMTGTIVGDPVAMLVDEDKFPDHLSSTWPYMTKEQRAAIRYLEAGFRAVRKAK